jgi:hypothetical protein
MSFAKAVSDRVCVIDKGTIKFSRSFAALEANVELMNSHLFMPSRALN